VVRNKPRVLGAFSLKDPVLGRATSRCETPIKPKAKKTPAGIWAITLLSPWDTAKNKDNRDDPIFLKTLDKAGKLDEGALARPRMSRDEVIAAARKMNIKYMQGCQEIKPRSVPDNWKITTVTFCREAITISPSINILGFTGPNTFYGIWIVQFDASDDPESEKAYWRQIACLVDDATGNVRTIYPPHYVKSLPVRGADFLPSKPITTEKKVRKVAGKYLKEITQVSYYESIEVLPLIQDKKYQVWQPKRCMWVCEGTDRLGNRTEIILTDRKPFHRGPENALEGVSLRLRRLVQPQQTSSVPTDKKVKKKTKYN
ncbi:MAG: hypothetical protein K8R02_10020, partial [Anaerohalosphaeraceae bacterium]|nr:hypothetical protein [Anaerohalosphaeraceae bacterium]